MKIILDKRKCVGCGNCQMACQKIFKVGEDGKSSLLPPSKKMASEFIEELEISNKGDIECAQSAAEACPIGCITIKE